ncbi:MAG: S9 family peptidase [Pseudomonadota bacterium]
MLRYLLAGTAMLFVAGAGQAASDAATRFGARENVQQISLSPDGKHIAVIQPSAGAGSTLFTVSVADGTVVAVTRGTGFPDRLLSCYWASNTRLTCSIQMIVNDGTHYLGFDRILAIDLDGKNMKMLSARTTDRALGNDQDGGTVIDWQIGGDDGAVLMTHNYVPEYSTGTHLANATGGLGVDLVDTTTLKHRVIEQPRDGATRYLTDGHGTVRIMAVRGSDSAGYDANLIRYSYRTKDSRSWQLLGTETLNGSVSVGFTPVAVDRDKDIAYGFDAINGHTALFSVALDGSGKREAVLARDDVDVDELIRLGRSRRVVGASFVTDRRETVYFDPELKRLTQSLGKALPATPLIDIIDASADESKLLIVARGDVDPGRYYLYDKTNHHLDEVLPTRPQLADTKLAPVKPMTYAAADGTQIPGYLTLPPGSDGKNLPTIVMPHGGPDSRDEWGFDWLVQFFANRGYAVLQPNFRGSTGYGQAYFNKNGFHSWQTAIGDVNDGGRWLIKQGIADPARLAIVGWSYGGYAALQSAVLDPNLFKAIVAVAPVTDLETLRQEHQGFTDFVQVDAQIGHGAYVRAGSPAQNVDRFVAPVLLFHGDRDQNVGIGESRLMASRLKGAGKTVELIEFHNLDHQLDDSGARAGMLDKMDGFLRTSLHLPPAP